MDKRKITLSVIAVAVLLVVLVGTTFAYWTLNGTPKTSANVQVQTGGLILRLDDTEGSITTNDVIDPNNLSFSKYFSITNESAADGYAKVLFKGLTNTFVSDALVYDLEEVQADKTSYATPRMIITNEVLPKSAVASNQVLADGLLIEKGTLSGNTVTANTKYYKLTVRYKYSDTVDQSEDVGATLVSGFTIEEGQMSVSMTVSFVTNDANITAPNNITVTMGSTYENLPILTKSGYRLEGWYTDNLLTEKVTNESKVLKSGNHTLYAKWIESLLPADYTQLSYLESNGKQYINTELSMPSGFHIIGKVMLMDDADNDYIFGSHATGTPAERNFLGIIKIYDKYVWNLGSGSDYREGNIIIGNIYDFEASTIPSNLLLIVNNEPLELSISNVSTGINSGYNYLYALNIGGAGYYISARIYDIFEVYSSSDKTNKVAAFVPAKCTNISGCSDGNGGTIANNKVGMYDVVRNRFFVNQGSGADFTPGEELW